MSFVIAAAFTFFGMFFFMPAILFLLRLLGFYTVVEEGTCHVYVLFGKVLAVLDEAGFYFLWTKLGLAAPIVNWLGKRYMGIGIWCEMRIGDPVGYLFKNADPRGSLAANVSNATVRCLSNMKLAAMLENRHDMSQTVRAEVSPKSEEWGFQLGSIYIRKVHFRDLAMIQQIQEKVVNRLRQVTSAIKQDGANQVSIITNQVIIPLYWHHHGRLLLLSRVRDRG